MIELTDLTPADLAAIEPWFDDAETQIRLGGRDWPHMVLSLVAPPDRIALLVRDNGVPVALVDVEHLATTSFAIVVAPERRGRGVAKAVLGRLLETELAGRPLSVGAETDNYPSRGLLERFGFRAVATDDAGFLEYVRP